MQAADWPAGFEIEFETKRPQNSWAFVPPKQVAVPINPSAPDHWQRHPIDAFIYRKLNENGLQPSPPVERETLIRRITLDLTGLPPDWNDVRKFSSSSDEIDATYSDLVDRLLASPRYGERWAQHWLDVIRWAETVGFETNLARPNAWHYRDWVIDALNADKPYDQFIFEQIAGDSVAQDAALGFLVAGPANLPGQIGRDESAMRQARQDELDEVIRTVSQSLFGLTIGCARCHDHKFDPITMRDYYAMQAIFAGLSYGDRRLRGEQNDRWTEQLPAARERLEQLVIDREQLRKQHHLRPEVARVQLETFEPILAEKIRMRINATGNQSPASLYEFEVFSTEENGKLSQNVALAESGAIPSASGFALANQTRHFDNLTDGSVDQRQAFPWVNDKPGPAWIQVELPEPIIIDRIRWHNGSSVPADYVIEVLPPKSTDWQTIADAMDRMPRIDDTRPAGQIQLANLSTELVADIVRNRDQIRAAQSEVHRLAAGPQVYAAQFNDSPEPTWQLRRGDPMQRVERVDPAVPAVLNGDPSVTADSPKSLRGAQD